MSKTYTQCKLKQGNSSKTVWIPTEFAVVGKVLHIKDADKENDVIHIRGKALQRIDLWDVGWLVDEIYLTADEDRVILKEPLNGWW